MFLNILLFTTVSYAGSEFTFIDQGERSPIEGVVFNPEALSEVLVTPERLKQECEIEWTRTIERKENEFILEIEKEKIRYNALNKKHTIMLIEKDTEINELQEIVKKQSPAYKWMWFAIGIAAGGATYYGIEQVTQ
jgi:hypothetical protein